MIKKDVIIAILVTFMLTTAFFGILPTRSAPAYDPWLDVNDDGRVDMRDIGAVCNGFGQHGTAVDKASIEYDSEWINITDKCGQYFNITHNLNSTDLIVDITGRTTPSGGIHQKYIGLASYTTGWSKTYGGAYDDSGCSVLRTSDGGCAIAGYTASYGVNGDAYLIRTDAGGNMLWNKTYGGTNNEYVYSMVQTTDGGYALAGYTNSFGAGSYDFYLVRTDSFGNKLWNKTYGGTSGDYGWSVVQTTDGGYALAGHTRSYGAGIEDVYLVRTDSAGVMLWNRTYGGTGSDYGYSVVQTSDGGYTMTGYTQSYGAGGQDLWLVKTDSSGNLLWNKTYGGMDMDCEFSVVQTSDGGFAVVGWTLSYGAGAGYKDVWLVKTDAELGLAWTNSDSNTITLYRGATDPYWNFVRVRIWKPKNP
jgi:hypothetical protein